MFPLKEVYQEHFSCWEDVVREFTGCRWDNESAAKAIQENPEPQEVFLARYDHGGYDGSAIVIWRQGRKYFLLRGSHCSCYGLEETGFDPEEFSSKSLFIEYLKKVNYIYPLTDEELAAFIDFLEKR